MFQTLQLEIHKNRIYGLDVLRCAAILMVLIEHGMLLLQPIFEWLDFMKLGGYWGVELFFVLSGFLIGGILIRTYEQEEKFSCHALLSFWKRRWFRTLPLYYLILCLNLALFYRDGHEIGTEELLYFVFLQNFWERQSNFFAEAWSLAVEEWFYLIFPLLLYLFNHILLVIKTKKHRFLISALCLFCVVIWWRYDQVTALNPHWDGGVRKVVAFRLDAILTGVLMAWLVYYYKILVQQYQKIFLFFGVLLIAGSFWGYYAHILGGGMSNTPFLYKTFYFNWTSLGFALFLPYASEVKREKLSKTASIVTLISIISYSIYLLHLSVVLGVLYQCTTWNTTIATSLLFYMMYLLLTIFLSVLMYVFFEKPMLGLRERF